MQEIKQYLYGGNFGSKLSEFINELYEINQNYKGDFDSKSPYCTTITRGSQITLVFDTEKEIPIDLKHQVLEAFKKMDGENGAGNF